MSDEYIDEWLGRAIASAKKLHNVTRITFEITKRKGDDLWINLYFFDAESKEAFKVYHDVHVNVGGTLNIELGS